MTPTFPANGFGTAIRENRNMGFLVAATSVSDHRVNAPAGCPGDYQRICVSRNARPHRRTLRALWPVVAWCRREETSRRPQAARTNVRSPRPDAREPAALPRPLESRRLPFQTAAL